jgi:hypothetical protein
MADKLFEDLLKNRDTLVVRLREQAQRSSAALDKAAAAEDPHELLSRYVARLHEANKAKDEAIERYDEEISHYARLINELEEKMAAKRGEDEAYEHAAESDTAPDSPSEPPADPQPDPTVPRDRAGKKGAKRKDG